MFRQPFNPYRWGVERSKGRALYFVDHGLRPGLIAGVAYAALMALFGSDSSPYLNAAAFALLSTPIYVLMSARAWEANEDAFAEWVVKENQRLMRQMNRKRAS